MKRVICNARGDVNSVDYKKNLQITPHQWSSEAIAAQPLFVRCGMEAERFGECYFQHQRCPELILSLVTGGAVSFEENGETVTLQAGSIYLIHHNSKTAFFTEHNGYYKKEVLCLNGIILNRLIESLRLNKCRALVLRDPDSIGKTFRKLFDLLDQKETGTEKTISGMLYELLISLAEEFREAEKPQPKQLAKAINYVEQHFQEDIKLADICSASGTSQSTLVRLFQKHMNTHPKAYLMDIRLEFARSLMLSSDMQLKEIAWRAGYRSQFYFSTAFRKKWGMSPKKYRQNRPDINPYNNPG